MNVSILWSYPCVFHRIRRVDSRYAYLVVDEGYVPLRRREGVLCRCLPYDVYGEWKWNAVEYFEKVLLKDFDEVSTFFQTQMMKEEYGELQTIDEKICSKNVKHNITVKSTVMYV